MLALLASIPSPSSGSISLGPLDLRAYGLMIAIGVIVAVWVAGKRFEAKGIGTMDDMQSIALWAVPAGVIGARLYHVITDWQRFEDNPLDAVKIWEGGLGIWGGVLVGVLVGVWRAHKRGIPTGPGLDAVAPAIALAQAIGRWGNWFNQELFGRPTDLPWGLEIDPSHRPDGYEQYETFHPTFLYESLWLLVIAGLLLWIDTRRPMRAGRLFALYVALYTFGRFWIERIRIDEANTILGLRVNEWTSSIVCLLAVGYLVVDWLRHRNDPETPAPAEGDADDSDAVEVDADAGADDGEPREHDGDPSGTEPQGAEEPVADDPDADGSAALDTEGSRGVDRP